MALTEPATETGPLYAVKLTAPPETEVDELDTPLDTEPDTLDTVLENGAEFAVTVDVGLAIKP